MTRPAGFTLLELLVALAVFALMAAMAYGGLASVLATREGVNAALERTAGIQGALHRMQRDIEQTVDRPIRDGFGDSQPALAGSPGEGLRLSRGGWRNPLSEPRSDLQRVAFRVDEEGRLVRRHWRVLDRAQDSMPVETVLIEAVDELEWRFLAGNREWRDAWPPADPSGTGPANPGLPLAVELRLVTPAWGELRHLFFVPGARP